MRYEPQTEIGVLLKLLIKACLSSLFALASLATAAKANTFGLSIECSNATSSADKIWVANGLSGLDSRQRICIEKSNALLGLTFTKIDLVHNEIADIYALNIHLTANEANLFKASSQKNLHRKMVLTKGASFLLSMGIEAVPKEPTVSIFGLDKDEAERLGVAVSGVVGRKLVGRRIAPTFDSTKHRSHALKADGATA